MNQSTKIMFLIGLIFNILEIVALVVGIFVCAIATGASEQIYQELVNRGVEYFKNSQEVLNFCVSGVVACVFALMLSVAILVIAMLSQKRQRENSKGKALPITLIVLCALNLSHVFYIVAGILCLVENSQSTSPAPVKTEDKKE